MADFRRWILALAMLVLVLGSVAPASAQSQQAFACTANAAVPPTIRQEGLTELTGDIVLNCTGGTPTPVGTTIPQANITVFLTNPVTSKIIGSATEALLLVDDPGAGQQLVCPAPTNPLTACAIPGDGGTSFKTNGQFNVYQGIVAGPNAITFLGVPIDPPASSGAPARIYRITNIRANASTTAAVNTAGVVPVQAFISASGSTSVPINNPSPLVGFILTGLKFTAAGTSTSFLQCAAITTPTTIATLTYTENFATAFKVRDANPSSLSLPQPTPGQIYNTESGLTVAVPGGTAGLADSGTRLYATFNNLPTGMTLSVSTSAESTSGVGAATLVGSATAADPSPYGTPGVVAGTTDVTSSIAYGSAANSGTVTVVWEVTYDGVDGNQGNPVNPVSLDSFVFTAAVTFTGVLGNGTGTTLPNVTGGFAPWVSTGVPVQVPTFVQSTNAATPLFSVAQCQTILLFPYVTDFPGFDTGIAISNTSKDNLTLGAAPQTGACSVSFYGGVPVAGTPASFTDTSANLGTAGVYTTTAANSFGTGTIAPGQTWAFSVSTIDSTFGSSSFQGFVGYAIASCDFQYAHGYSFVSDYGIRNFAAAYLALIIPDAPRTAAPFTCSSGLVGGCTPTGEQLVH